MILFTVEFTLVLGESDFAYLNGDMKWVGLLRVT